MLLRWTFAGERQVAAATAQLAAVTSSVEGMRSQLAEARLQIDAIERQFAEKVSTELRDVQVRRAALEQKINKADARFGRHDIVAPQDGVAMNLRYFSAGAVVPPGGSILDLVPLEDALTVEARIQPIDIDSVRPDLPAKLRLVAYKQRTTPVLDGTVLRVSPDAKVDERSGHAYFVATIETDPDQLSRLHNVRLYPGMPVDVSVVTGERTMLDYIVQFLVDSFAQAFAEE
jgi:HlyD family type I secretion membrane fusion protein